MQHGLPVQQARLARDVPGTRSSGAALPSGLRAGLSRLPAGGQVACMGAGPLICAHYDRCRRPHEAARRHARATELWRRVSSRSLAAAGRCEWLAGWQAGRSAPAPNSHAQLLSRMQSVLQHRMCGQAHAVCGIRWQARTLAPPARSREVAHASCVPMMHVPCTEAEAVAYNHSPVCCVSIEGAMHCVLLRHDAPPHP